MGTQVWSFLIVVILCSVAGYFLMKHYASYHVNRKTRMMIEEFRRQQGVSTEDKPVAQVEKELMEDLEKNGEESSGGTKPEPSSGDRTDG